MNKNKLRMRADKLLKTSDNTKATPSTMKRSGKTAPYLCGRLRQWKRAQYTTVRQ